MHKVAFAFVLAVGTGAMACQAFFSEPGPGGEGGASGDAGASGVGGASLGGNGSAGTGGSAGAMGGSAGGGTGGSAGAAGRGGSVQPADCRGVKPASLVPSSTGGSTQFQIDATEVTRCQYKVWLDTSPDAALGRFCNWNKSLLPECAMGNIHWPPRKGEEKLPMTCIDWCDALAYCYAMGKRLCGSRAGGGKAVAFDDYANAQEDQWQFVCSSNGQNDYPYGKNYQAQTCNGRDRNRGGPVSVTEYSACRTRPGAYAGVYDLSGNVWEWENCCDNQASPDKDKQRCRARGGSYDSDQEKMKCSASLAVPRNTHSPTIGFRCCK